MVPLLDLLLLFAIYESFAILYYAYRSVFFLRKGNTFVFSSRIPNACSTKHAFYTLRDTHVEHCRHNRNNVLHFQVIATRVVDNGDLQVVITVEAKCDFKDSQLLDVDPKSYAISEISGAIVRYINTCNELYFYLLFGKNEGCINYINKECCHVQVSALHLCIDDARLIAGQACNNEPAEDLMSHDMSTEPVP